MNERLTDLERRLAYAQRQVRILGVLTFVASVAIAACLVLRPSALAAQAEAEKKLTTVKAPFEVVGADGSRLMAVEEDGDGAVVRFYRSGKKIAAMLDCSPAGTSFALFSPSEKMCVVLDSLVDGGGMTMYNGEGKEGVLLKTTTGQNMQMTLTDKSGKVLFALPAK
jgi:hypothetical protein